MMYIDTEFNHTLYTQELFILSYPCMHKVSTHALDLRSEFLKYHYFRRYLLSNIQTIYTRECRAIDFVDTAKMGNTKIHRRLKEKII